MHFNNLALALASIASVVVRADVGIDSEDIPKECSEICEPIRQLSQACDVDDDNIPSDRTENELEAQCVCTNDSFDVAKIAALCASCVSQHQPQGGDEDDYDDIDDIMRTCGFSSTSYDSSASTAAQDITVVATAPTASSQLTTTVGGGGGGGSSSSPTDTTTVTSSGSDTTVTQTQTSTNTNGGGGGAGGGASNTDDSGSGGTSETPTDNAAPGLAPAAGLGGVLGVGLYVVGMIAIGAGAVY